MLPPLLSKLGTQQTLIAAHRGASGHFVENTIEAFEKAIELGADMIELDVRLTKDEQIICYHDDTIDGVPAHSLSYSQIADKNIPLLDTVLEKFHDKIYFVIEVKPPRLGQHIHISPALWLSLVSNYNLFGKIVFASEDIQYLFLLKQTMQSRVFYCAVLSPVIESTWEEGICGLDGIICSIADSRGLLSRGVRDTLNPSAQSPSAIALKDKLFHLKPQQKAFSQMVGVYGVRTEADVALCRQHGIRFIGTDYPKEIRQLINSYNYAQT